MVVLIKALEVLIGEVPGMRQLSVHSPALSYFRNNMIYKRMQNHNFHFNPRMSSNKGILYLLFLEHHRCQIMHRVPSWHWVLVSLEAAKLSFQKDVASGSVLTWLTPGAMGASMAFLASLHSDRTGNSKKGCSLRNGWRLGVNCLQPPSREFYKSTINVLKK